MADPRMVEVVWVDSGMHIDHGWASTEKYLTNIGLDRMTVRTVGIRVHEDDEALLVALSHDPAHDKWQGMQLILKDNIRHWCFLEPSDNG